MKINRESVCFLIYLAFLCNIIHSSCVNPINTSKNLNFTHLLSNRNLGFIINSHSLSNSANYKNFKDRLNKFESKIDDKHTHLHAQTNTESNTQTQNRTLPNTNPHNNKLTESNTLFNKVFEPYIQPYRLVISKVNSNVAKVKNLVLSSSSNLKSVVNKYVERAKSSHTYQVLAAKYDVLKQRMANLSVADQFGVLLAGNALYSFILPKYHIVFPFQLFPSESGLGTEIGLDTLLSVPVFYYLFKHLKISDSRFKMTNTSLLKLSAVVSSLVGSFFLSAYFASLMDSLVLLFSALNIPVSLEMLTAVSIISGHLFWITIGSTVLHKYVFPIFGEENNWYKLDFKKTWVYQVLSGYFSSCLVYKLVDTLYLLLSSNFNIKNCQSPTDQTITKVCDSNETLPIVLTSIAPCITAPWWEELLYRVFSFKVFNTFLPSLPSSVISSLLFSLNHLSMGSFVQLFSLGLLWSLIQNDADNVLVTFLIHCLWNSRIFLGSLTGF